MAHFSRPILLAPWSSTSSPRNSYQGFNNIERKLYVQWNELYDAGRICYLEAVASFEQTNSATGDAASHQYAPYPVFEEWLCRSVGVIGGDVIRSRFLKHYYDAKGVVIGDVYMSLNMFLTRRLQSIPCEEPASFDYAHSPAKTFNDPDINVQANLVSDATEVLVPLMTKTEKPGEVAHAIQLFAHRHGVHLTLMTTDTCPVDSPFWEKFFPGIKKMCDIFHGLHRILPTLRSPHCAGGQAARALSAAFWRYSPSDIAAVDAALLDGTLNGKSHSAAEIVKLKTSGVYKERCVPGGSHCGVFQLLK
jgi:hypothetical protein